MHMGHIVTDGLTRLKDAGGSANEHIRARRSHTDSLVKADIAIHRNIDLRMTAFIQTCPCAADFIRQIGQPPCSSSSDKSLRMMLGLAYRIFNSSCAVTLL